MRFFHPLFIAALLPALVACGSTNAGQPPQPPASGATAAPAAQPARGLPQCAGAPSDHAPALPQPTQTGLPRPCATPAPASSAGAGAATPLQGQRAIGLPSQGQAVELEVGETFELKLTGAMAWTVEIADNTIIAQLPGQLMPDSQGVFEALAPGRTVLAADGEPLCRSATPACMTPLYHFELALLVRAPR